MKTVKKAARKPVRRNQSRKSRPVSKVAEQQVVADREAVRTEVSGIRAGAARLLDLFDYEAGQLLKDGTVVPEKNRTPPAKERVHKKVVGPEGKKTGQKSVKNSPSRGRG